jgi:putative 4-mercaptohistidine N1-methyltranferase
MTNPYESKRYLDEYLLFHYGSDDEVMPWEFGPREALGFGLRTVARFSPGERARALDLGCAVGRSTFELTKTNREVLGIDYSAAFIAAARRLAAGETIAYDRREEGHQSVRLEARLPPDVHPRRARFEVGDATDLRPDLGTFDRVHAANLLCRLPDPQKLLGRLPALVVPGGELVIATPCSWLAEFTPPDRWPPGSTLTWLEHELAGTFEIVRRADEPLLIRETARKFQWTVSLVSVWKRRGT